MFRRLLLFILLVASFTATAAPSIEVLPTGMRAIGMTPGAETVWFYYYWNGSRRGTDVVIATDDDLDGIVEIEVTVNPRAVWVVVDMTTGAVGTLVRPEAFFVTPMLVVSQWVAGATDVVVREGTFVNAVIIRRDGGIWWAPGIFEGGALDRYPIDLIGFDLSSIASYRPQGGPRLTSAAPGDILIMVAPSSGGFVVLTASAAPIPTLQWPLLLLLTATTALIAFRSLR